MNLDKNYIIKEAEKMIDECTIKTGLTKGQIILYLSGKVNRRRLLINWFKKTC